MSDRLGSQAFPNRSRPQGLGLEAIVSPVRDSLRRTSTAPWHRLWKTRSRRTRIRTR